MKINKGKLRQSVKLFLEALGLDLNDEHLAGTPSRVMRAWIDHFAAGYSQDPKDILVTDFTEEKYDQMIVIKDIPVMSYCAHHIVPFIGKAKIGYLPNKGKVVGISKLPRTLYCFAKRLQIQERLTQQTAQAINDIIKPKGVGVIIEAEHMCMTRRGVKSPGSITITSCLLGSFRDEPETRAEFLNF